MYLREKNTEYNKSIQINNNLVLDLDNENKVIGFEMLNFSKDSGIKKEILRNITN
ncbi:MAG: hypothetical protein COT55_00485 [Candidatus Diapherotrites archaeon CG09_land_8_20_14_0_10_32_12]|nr:MAG: hypothetical protein COT55_00485 [Candidatus Diapherotrites archaeon CG09_land_8_20_14_0_10_32_12]